MNRFLQATLLAFTVTLLGQFVAVDAQDKAASFKGRIFRSDTNKPIPNARLILLDEKKSEKQDNSQETRTDADGNFSLDSVKAGKYTLSIRVVYDREEDVPCQLLMGKLKGEKDSVLIISSEGGKKIYQVFIKGFAIKANKNITKDYDLVCISAFGG